MKNYQSESWKIQDQSDFNQNDQVLQKIEKISDRRNNDKKKQKFIRNFWSPQEDKLLAQLVKKHGIKKWTLVSRQMKNRSAKRCRERWMNYLDTGKIKNLKWSDEEKWHLYLCYKIHGNKWSAIANILNRGDNIVKNQLNSLKRKKMVPYNKKLREFLKDPRTFVNQKKITSFEEDLLQKILTIQNINMGSLLNQIENQSQSQYQNQKLKPQKKSKQTSIKKQKKYFFSEKQMIEKISEIKIQEGQATKKETENQNLQLTSIHNSHDLATLFWWSIQNFQRSENQQIFNLHFPNQSYSFEGMLNTTPNAFQSFNLMNPPY